MFPRVFYRIFFTALFFAAFAVQAQTEVIQNSGFIPKNLWFGSEPSKVDETVKIYTLVWNSSPNDLSGTVSFFDNDVLIGKQSFILAGAGSSKVLEIPWTVGEGYHKIYAQITDSAGGPRGETASAVSLQYGKTVEAENFISAPKPASGGATTTVSNFVSDKVDLAKGYVETNLPKPVVESAQSVLGSIESVRISAGNWSSSTVAMIQKDLKAQKENKDKTSNSLDGFNIKGPLKYAELFLLSIVAFVLGSKWLSYSFLVVITFFILRFIKRKFFF